jgi:hypothetical protein
MIARLSEVVGRVVIALALAVVCRDAGTTTGFGLLAAAAPHALLTWFDHAITFSS